MAAEDIKYQARTVKCLRGMEARTAARWERDGWELVSQAPGRVQTELHLRRPVRKISPRSLLIGGGATAALALVIVLGATGVFGDDDTKPAASASRAPVAAQSAPVTTETASPDGAVTLTAANSPELAALLQLREPCDASVEAFAAENAGRTVEFDAAILKMQPHGTATTRYDMLIGAGDYSETSQRGPNFQFRDVNTVSDLHYVGAVPDSIGEGANIGVRATLGEYNATQCLFQLTPVETSFR